MQCNQMWQVQSRHWGQITWEISCYTERVASENGRRDELIVFAQYKLSTFFFDIDSVSSHLLVIFSVLLLLSIILSSILFFLPVSLSLLSWVCRTFEKSQTTSSCLSALSRFHYNYFTHQIDNFFTQLYSDSSFWSRTAASVLTCLKKRSQQDGCRISYWVIISRCPSRQLSFHTFQGIDGTQL